MTRFAADMRGCGFTCSFLAESRNGKGSSSSPAAEAAVPSARLCALLVDAPVSLQCTDCGKYQVVWGDIVYLDSFNGVSCGSSDTAYFLQLWRGRRGFETIRLAPSPGNEYNTAWVSCLSVADTSFNSHDQDVEVSLAYSWEISLLLGYLKRKEYRRRDVCLWKWPHETIIPPTLLRFDGTLCSSRRFSVGTEYCQTERDGLDSYHTLSTGHVSGTEGRSSASCA